MTYQNDPNYANNDFKPFEFKAPQPPKTATSPEEPHDTTEDLLGKVEKLMTPFEFNSIDEERYIERHTETYYQAYDTDHTLGATEKFTGNLAEYSRKLAMLSHRNYDLGFSTEVYPTNSNGLFFTLTLKKSPKRIKEDLQAVTERAVTAYKEDVMTDEASRVIALQEAQDALKASLQVDLDYQDRLSSALQYLG